MKTPLSILEKNKKESIKHAIATTVSQNLVNAYIPLFAISVIGVTNQQMGLINSLPSLISLFSMVIGSYYLSRTRSKKWFTMTSFFLARIGIGTLVFVPFIPAYQGWILVGIVALANFPGALGNLAWQSMIADLIPEQERNAFFSVRSRMLTIAAMFTSLTSGYTLQLFDKSDPKPYIWMFSLGILFGLLEVCYLWKHTENKTEQKTEKKKFSLKENLLFFLKEKPYLTFLVCAIVFNFGWQMAWASMNIYQIKYAHATALWISLFSVFNQLAQIVSYKYWGRMADKIGNSMSLFWVCVGMATAPVLMIVSTNLYWLTAMNLFTGLFVSGTTMLLFNQLLKVSPDENRTSYIAHYNTVIALVGFVAPQTGVYILDNFGMMETMVSSTLVRVLGGVLFLLAAIYYKKQRGKSVEAR